MTIDHLAWLFFPGFPEGDVPVTMHVIGRLTCPIMCLFIAEGFHYTRDLNKYTSRLFLFSVVAHVPYLYASADYVDWRSFLPLMCGSFLNQTSVMWPLAWGLVMLRVYYSSRIKKDVIKLGLILLICLVSFPADWSCVASLLILGFGVHRGNFGKQALVLVILGMLYAFIYCMAVDPLYGVIQLGIILSLPLIYLYNGSNGANQRLNQRIKWLFYWYYPFHLLLIGLLMHLA